jgi:hypothetical protein
VTSSLVEVNLQRDPARPALRRASVRAEREGPRRGQKPREERAPARRQRRSELQAWIPEQRLEGVETPGGQQPAVTRDGWDRGSSFEGQARCEACGDRDAHGSFTGSRASRWTQKRGEPQDWQRAATRPRPCRWRKPSRSCETTRTDRDDGGGASAAEAERSPERAVGVDPAGRVGGGEESPGEADRSSTRSPRDRSIRAWPGRRTGTKTREESRIASNGGVGATRRKTSRTPPETVKVGEGAGKPNDPLRTHRGAHTGTDRRRHGPAHDILEGHVEPEGRRRRSGPRERHTSAPTESDIVNL